MEHVNEATAAFYACADMSGQVTVRQAWPARVVAVIPHGVNGMPESEGWKWGTRIARGLCYHTAGLNRAHRAFWRGTIVGGVIGVVLGGLLLVSAGWKSPTACVNVGPYSSIPNG